MTYTSADLDFDPGQHVYTLPDGRTPPSVTKILKTCGISTDFDALGAMGDHLRERIEYRRAIGTAIHADAHAFDDGELDESTVHPDVLPFLDAWKVFRENSRLVPLTRERRVFHPLRFYCGTLDGIFEAPDGDRVLIDIKIGNPDDCGAAFQTAAYMDAWLLEHPDDPIDERWAVRLTPDNGIPYRVYPYTDWRDAAKFASFVTTYHAMQDNRRAFA